MTYTITFLGLVNFFELEPKGRLVLLPDGRNPPDDIDPEHKIDPHHASLFVHCEDIVDFSQWWPSVEGQAIAALHVRELPIQSPSTIAISGMEESRCCAPFDDSPFEERIIRLKEINPRIEIKPECASTIAQIPIRRGTLASRRIGHAIIAQLDVQTHIGPVTVIARPDDCSQEKTLTLKEGCQIAIANISDNLHPNSDDPLASHFRLYAQLDTRRDANCLRTPTNDEVIGLGIEQIRESSHRYIQHLIDFGAVPGSQCSVSGCCTCLSQTSH